MCGELLDGEGAGGWLLAKRKALAAAGEVNEEVAPSEEQVRSTAGYEKT